MFKLSVLLVDSSSLLGLLGISPMLTSCHSAGGEFGLGGEGEDRGSRREERYMTDFCQARFSHTFGRGNISSHVSTGQSVNLVNYYFLLPSR